jgi:hypothetical protein
MSHPSFSQNTPNKIGKGNKVSGKNTLIKVVEDDDNDNRDVRVAIADEPIDAKVDGKKLFCVRVDDGGDYSAVMIGFTTMETFDSNKHAFFGSNGFTACGISLDNGFLYYPVYNGYNVIEKEISSKAKEIIVILTISNNGKKKEIQFLCDGKESESTDVSGILNEDLLFPAICLRDKDQQVTTIPIDEVTTGTPEIEELIKEYQQQNSKNNNQSGGAVASPPSPAQLQKELAEALQTIAALSAELKKKDEEIAALKEQLESLKK